MPSKYIEKQYDENSYYHVFNRGVEKRDIFIDDDDFSFFLYLFQRYLGPKIEKDNKNRNRPNYSQSVDLLAYCLMPNHVHILLYQRDKDSMQKFMSSLSTAYSMYFNKKYKRVGKLFQSRYKAVLITDDSQFTHISRYIHLNPKDVGQSYMTYKYSSLAGWLDNRLRPSWIKPEAALSEFSGPKSYENFLAQYEKAKEELDLIKKQLKE